MSQVIHVFYDVHMGAGHRSLMEIIEANTKRRALKMGELVVFLNRPWTACKILAPDGLMLYYRSPNAQVLTADTIRSLPQILEGKRFQIDGTQAQSMSKEHAERFKAQMERLKVAKYA